MSDNSKVKTFYEHNTRRFLRWGGGKNEGVIHREVWGEGVETKEQAFHYCHHLLLQRLPLIHNRPIRVLDLGCGVGSSLFYLCRHANQPIDATGVSISPTQIGLAKERAQQIDFNDQCTFIEADFSKLPALKPIDFVYAIEAFVHATNTRAFFEQTTGLLAEKGRLCIIDDFLLQEGQDELVERFCRGWQIGNLHTVSKVEAIAAEFGLELNENVDLTSYLNLGRPRDWLIKGGLSIPGVRKIPSLYLKSLDGGDALQSCLAKGKISYRLLQFSRP